MEELKVGDLVTFSDIGRRATNFKGPLTDIYTIIEAFKESDSYYFDSKGHTPSGKYGVYGRYLRKAYSNSF